MAGVAACVVDEVMEGVTFVVCDFARDKAPDFGPGLLDLNGLAARNSLAFAPKPTKSVTTSGLRTQLVELKLANQRGRVRDGCRSAGDHKVHGLRALALGIRLRLVGHAHALIEHSHP